MQLITIWARQYIIPAPSKVVDKDGLASQNSTHEFISLKKQTQQDLEITSTTEPAYYDGPGDNSPNADPLVANLEGQHGLPLTECNKLSRYPGSTNLPSASSSISRQKNYINLKTQQRRTTSTRSLRSSSARDEANPQAIGNYLPRNTRKLSNAYPVDVGDPMDSGTP